MGATNGYMMTAKEARTQADNFHQKLGVDQYSFISKAIEEAVKKGLYEIELFERNEVTQVVLVKLQGDGYNVYQERVTERDGTFGHYYVKISW